MHWKYKLYCHHLPFGKLETGNWRVDWNRLTSSNSVGLWDFETRVVADTIATLRHNNLVRLWDTIPVEWQMQSMHYRESRLPVAWLETGFPVFSPSKLWKIVLKTLILFDGFGLKTHWPTNFVTQNLSWSDTLNGWGFLHICCLTFPHFC